ncbi:MAG: CRTAC1 family protein [Cyclobacteriaceae bacterium]|nr:CRTAC1 family protein [Cyclobacteriaceae bacterium]
MSGEPLSLAGSGLVIAHNDGNAFSDVSHLLPDIKIEGRQVKIADYNQDGDQDIFILETNGLIRLLRNDGANTNHFLKLQLVGLRSGSGKNNYYGIGAEVEVRAGELYQKKLITEPGLLFGIGQREKVDVVRILWTNGVPQNIFSPGTDQDLIEEQELKGSCPFLYSWDGEKFVFVKDMMWRSALGMPLGIMGGKAAYAFADASEEYLKILGNRSRLTMGNTPSR